VHTAAGTPLADKGKTRRSSLVKGLTSLTNMRKPSTTGSALGSAMDDGVSVAASDEGGSEKKEASSSSEAENVGSQFWEFLTKVLELLWEPERQNEQLILMTTRFYKCGIRKEHLGGIGQAIEKSCRKFLDSQWNQYQESWDWFWNLCAPPLPLLISLPTFLRPI